MSGAKLLGKPALYLAGVAVCVSSLPCFAEPEPAARISHPIIPGFERFQSSSHFQPVDTGRLLLGELNCLSCHRADQTLHSDVKTKQAPILDDVGSRVRVDYLRSFLLNPQQTKPGTTMPHLLAEMPEAERKQNVEALVHFLAMTGSPVEQPADPRKIGNGERQFHELGCTACHAPRNGKKIAGETFVPLGDLSKKYTVPSLMQFLANPLAVRPSGRMPAPHLNKNETEEIVCYLLKDLAGVAADPELANLPQIPYRYYEGQWGNLPDFEKLEPKTKSSGPAFSPVVAESQNNFGLVFDGWFEAPADGEYTFAITSDDGSEILVDGKRVAINDGVHPATTQQRKVTLKQGPHQVTVRFFQVGGDIVLQVKMGGPGVPLGHLGPRVAASKEELLKKPETKPKESSEEPKFVIQPQLVDQGRELFASLGCASCHQLKENNQAIQTVAATRQRAKALQDLAGTGGCLDAAAKPMVPNFSLTAPQRKALAAALQSLQQSSSSETKPEHHIAMTMLRFNCYACHERNKVGGVPEARNELFATTQKEMGDEGRIPPSLGGVGAKLTKNWMNKIFSEGANDRPYMLTRMPQFGKANVGHLQELLDRVDTIERVEIPPIKIPERRLKSLGRMMTGDDIFGCIKCHTFKGQRALGIQSIDMAVMTQRLKHDWFHAYLVDPTTFRPGTRMPSAWPLGRSTLRDVLDGDTHKQIEAIWQYLSDGGNARPPQGLNRQAIVLAADKNAVIYRNFIEGAGPRAIGVAYPEKVNLAFDANEMRLALIWQNKFIDASKHWVGRGPGFQGPLGDQVLTLWAGSPFAELAKPDLSWPKQPAKEQGYRFQGYRLTDDNRPTLLYSLGSIHIEDYPTGISGEKSPRLKRRLSLTRKNDEQQAPLYFRAAVGKSIEKVADDTYRINHDYQIRIESGSDPVLVTVDGQTELRIPIQWNENRAKIVQEIIW